MTEGDILKTRTTPDSVGMVSYTIDSHNVQRYITPEGHVQNEVRCNYEEHDGKITILEPLLGQSGWLPVSMLIVGHSIRRRINFCFPP